MVYYAYYISKGANKMSGMAKYMEIYIDIRDKINQNKYEINEKLPDGDKYGSHV